MAGCSIGKLAGLKMLKITVRENFTEAVAHTLAKASTKAEHVVAIQAAKDTSPFVPALTGDLNRRTQVDGNLIIYPGPQSRMLYNGKLMIDPNTGSAWASKGVTKVTADRNLVFTKTYHSEAQDHWFEASKAQNLKKWVRVAEKTVKDEL